MTRQDPATREPVPPLGPVKGFARAVLLTVLVICVSLALHLLVFSRLQARAAQAESLDDLRLELAVGTAPVGPLDADGRLLQLGRPIAYLEIPAIGLQQVVGEGTSSSVLTKGPGHRRDTPLPGQVGTSVLLGRRAAFGGPFSDLTNLHEGDTITVTTGQGEFTFEVTGLRHDGDPVPTRAAGESAGLTLVTADGSAFLPNGAVRVDARLIGDAVGGAARPFTSVTLPRQERLMATDPTTLWALAFCLQGLVALIAAAMWSWHRWGRRQTWIVFLPAVLLVGLYTSGEAMRLLPNLM